MTKSFTVCRMDVENNKFQSGISTDMKLKEVEISPERRTLKGSVYDKDGVAPVYSTKLIDPEMNTSETKGPDTSLNANPETNTKRESMDDFDINAITLLIEKMACAVTVDSSSQVIKNY